MTWSQGKDSGALTDVPGGPDVPLSPLCPGVPGIPATPITPDGPEIPAGPSRRVKKGFINYYWLTRDMFSNSFL